MAPWRAASATRTRKGSDVGRRATAIEQQAGGIRNREADGSFRNLTGREIVSLNCWGFTLGLLDGLRRLFGEFLRAQPGQP